MKSNDGFFIEVRRMIPTLSLMGIMVLFQFRVGLNLYVIPKTGHYEKRGASYDYYILSKVNTLNGHG